MLIEIFLNETSIFTLCISQFRQHFIMKIHVPNKARGNKIRLDKVLTIKHVILVLYEIKHHNLTRWEGGAL